MQMADQSTVPLGEHGSLFSAFSPSHKSPACIARGRREPRVPRGEKDVCAEHRQNHNAPRAAPLVGDVLAGDCRPCGATQARRTPSVRPPGDVRRHSPHRWNCLSNALPQSIGCPGVPCQRKWSGIGSRLQARRVTSSTPTGTVTGAMCVYRLRRKRKAGTTSTCGRRQVYPGDHAARRGRTPEASAGFMPSAITARGVVAGEHDLSRSIIPFRLTGLLPDDSANGVGGHRAGTRCRLEARGFST